MNKVCFCFPLPFFPLPLPVPAAASADPEASPGATAGVVVPLPSSLRLPGLPHAGEAGSDSPRMFRRDWFPPTAPLGTRVDVDIGSSGKAARERFGGPDLVRAPGPGTDTGARTTGGVEAPDAAPAHGVLCWAWRNPLAPAAAGCRGGKAFAAEAAPGREGPCLDDEPAARATRSRT